MSSQPKIVIDIVGEGKTDVPSAQVPCSPGNGVLPVLVHKLCGRPANMLVRCRPLAFLMKGGSLAKKVKFARQQARISESAGIVVVVDSDGHWKKKHDELIKGRNMDQMPSFPTALGVAHPCIEAWLLPDAVAIQRAFKLKAPPAAVPSPEDLPPSSHDEQHPKNVLRKAAQKNRLLSAREKTEIAKEIDVDLLEHRCPRSFAPFAKEVRESISPLFQSPP